MREYHTRGCSKYGASMGRGNDLPADFVGKVELRAVPIDSQGYDPGGAYWGTPSNVFVAINDLGFTYYFRSDNFDTARQTLFEVYPHVEVKAPLIVTEDDIDDMLEGYMECALWASKDESDDGGESLDTKYSTADIAEGTKAAMRKDCETFARANSFALLTCIGTGNCDWSLAGHDLWLTRNGHAAGFGYGTWPEPHATSLDAAAEKMGETYLFVGDDGQIHD